MLASEEDDRDDFNWLAVSVPERRLFREISFLASCCFSQVSNGISQVLSSIKVFRGPATLIDAENSSGARVTGFFRPKPPRPWGQSEQIPLSESVGAGFPVKAGMKF